MSDPNPALSYVRQALASGNLRLADRKINEEGFPEGLYCSQDTEGWPLKADALSSDRAPAIHAWLASRGYPVQDPTYQLNLFQALLRRPTTDALDDALAQGQVSWPVVGTPAACFVLLASLDAPIGRLAWVLSRTGWSADAVSATLGKRDPVIHLVTRFGRDRINPHDLKDLAERLDALHATGVHSTPAYRASGLAFEELLYQTQDLPEEGRFLDIWSALSRQGHNPFNEVRADNPDGFPPESSAQAKAERRYPNLFRSQERQRVLAARPASPARPRLRS